MEDPTERVLIAADAAVQSLSPQARARLDAGAEFVRLPRYEARRLIEAVDALLAGVEE